MTSYDLPEEMGVLLCTLHDCPTGVYAKHTVFLTYIFLGLDITFEAVGFVAIM